MARGSKQVVEKSTDNVLFELKWLNLEIVTECDNANWKCLWIITQSCLIWLSMHGAPLAMSSRAYEYEKIWALLQIMAMLQIWLG